MSLYYYKRNKLANSPAVIHSQTLPATHGKTDKLPDEVLEHIQRSPYLELPLQSLVLRWKKINKSSLDIQCSFQALPHTYLVLIKLMKLLQ